MVFYETRRDPLSELFEELNYASRKDAEFKEKMKDEYEQWFPYAIKSITDANPLFKILTEKKRVNKKKFRWIS